MLPKGSKAPESKPLCGVKYQSKNKCIQYITSITRTGKSLLFAKSDHGPMDMGDNEEGVNTQTGPHQLHWLKESTGKPRTSKEDPHRLAFWNGWQMISEIHERERKEREEEEVPCGADAKNRSDPEVQMKHTKTKTVVQKCKIFVLVCSCFAPQGHRIMPSVLCPQCPQFKIKLGFFNSSWWTKCS